MRKPVLLKRSGTSQPAATPVVPQKKATPEKKGKKKSTEKENSSHSSQSDMPENHDQMAYEDESSTLTTSAIENYFMQGKTGSERMNNARARRGKRMGGVVEDDEEMEVDDMITDFAKCDLAGLRDYIANQDDSMFEKQLDYLEKNEFNKWTLYLASGFNILLHGVGSKREVVSHYIKQELRDFTYMRVDAQKEGVTPKTLLSSINENLNLNCTIKRGHSSVEWAREIRRQLQRHDHQLILIIDNIESADWRSEQEVLCELLEKGNVVKLIATVDHVYSTFIWNSRQLSSLSFIHVTVNTFQVAIHELMTGESRLLGLDARSNQSSHTMTSLDVFWKSLAANSQKLFRLFFQIFFETKKPVKFWDLFNAAKDDFIASTDSALRTQLVEFKDHRVLKWTRGDDGNDQLSGMVDLKLVTEFLNSKGMPLVEEKDE